MRQEHFVVTVAGTVVVDTKVAVMAKSSEEAGRIAVEGVECDLEKWLHSSDFYEAPTVVDVSEGTWDDLQCADQQHLLGPQQ